jgi:MFS family permease
VSRGVRAAPLWLQALGVTLAMQVTAAFLTQAMPVIGPSLTRAAGASPEQIGLLSALEALGTLWFLASGYVLLRRWGAVRVLQIGNLVGAFALLLPLSGTWSLMLLAGLLVGVGYGPAPPAGSEILIRHSPPAQRSLIFSIKQAGAPFGSAAAGLLLPPLVAGPGWRWALAAGAVVTALATFAVEPWRQTIDRTRERPEDNLIRELVSVRVLLLPFRVLASGGALRSLAIASLPFSCVQGCVFSFFVTDLNTGAGLSLTAAGSAFAVLQVVGMLARILMGFVADRLGSGMRTLVVLGIGSSLASLAAAALSLDLPWGIVLALSASIGLIGVSWNGVYLAEVARLAPEGRVGEATAASTLLTFLGYVAAPAAFTALVPLLGGYGRCFAAMALLPLIAAWVLYRAERRR